MLLINTTRETVLKKIDVAEFDVIFLSYDEPNAEENWSDLLNKVPWAQRVHGVKGFDAAHKAAAELSETQRFITVDADNIVMPDFFEQTLSIPDTDDHGNSTDEVIFSWNAKNLLNGLVYGNGGLKLWPKQYALNMRTHEDTQDHEGMEFCWKLNYVQLNDMFSEVHQTASPLQAFRAGFREGVKMSLDQGKKVSPGRFREDIWYGNFNRLQVWCNIGGDVNNGVWAIYGARLGCYMTTMTEWDPNLIADYAWIKEFFNTQIQPNIEKDNWLQNELIRLETELNKNLTGMMMLPVHANISEFFKTVYVNPRRFGAMITEKDILNLIDKGHNIY